MSATDAGRAVAGRRPGDSRLTWVAIAFTVVVLALLVAFLIWLAVADFSRAGSEAKIVGAALD